MMRFAVKFGLALTCASGLVVASCAHNDSSLYVYGVMAPPGGGATGGGCTYKPDPTQPQLFSGTLDIAFLAAYRPIVMVGNQLIQQGRSDGFRTETARIQLQGAIVTVEDSQGKQLDTYTTLSSGIADPSSGQAPGFGMVEVTLVSPAVVTQLRSELPLRASKRLVVRFKVFGQTLGGQSIESNEAQFPVDVCNGCLVFFPANSSASTVAGVVDCLAPVEEGATTTPCVAGQDEGIDCRTCQKNPACIPTSP